ncbi:glycosyltransferase family 4 protein [Roseateles sp. MS654]|uniref:glycosyltransferase family 4 protein n=1 Tax=Roseateles sp. MS654 TaxID=3412685 RepID=UPI003C2F9CC2
MTARKKILHLQLLPLMSGVQKVSLDELAHLDPARYERIAVCKCEGEFTEQLRRIGVRVHLVPELERAISPRQDVRAYLALRDYFRAERPDIVHTHSSKTGILGRLAAKAAKVPTIVHTVHGYAFPAEPRPAIKAIFKLLERKAGRVTDRMIVLNDTDAAIARDMLGVPGDRLAVLPNGVDVDTYAPAAPEQRQVLRQSAFGIGAPDHVLVGMVGRLWLQKNPQCFVRAAIQVAAQRDNVSFFMIGDGEFRGELEAAITASGQADRIRILGWRSDVPALLKALDLMVLPSRWEGMPLAILEAMSSGIPVIASDIPGNHHLVRDGSDGRLFPLDDADALAKATIDLIDDPLKRARFSAEARAKILAHYTLSARMNKITAIYEARR